METDPRYPIGRFEYEGPGEDARTTAIEAIAEAPRRLRAALGGLRPEQLETPYRPGGWTLRQVAHHLPDSHLNAYVRFKLALTEERPTIKPYDEARWAELPDVRGASVETSVALLEALHERWVALLRGLAASDWSREFVHPQHGTSFDLDRTLALYAWHGRHHVAQIASTRERNGW
jgi:hypothetical protein